MKKTQKQKKMREFSAVFIKCKVGSNAEKKVRSWIEELLGKTKEKKLSCNENCSFKKEQKERLCDSLVFYSAAVIAGYFDYILCIRSENVEEVESFVTTCLRNTFGSDLVVDTQTVAGCIIEPAESS